MLWRGGRQGGGGGGTGAALVGSLLRRTRTTTGPMVAATTTTAAAAASLYFYHYYYSHERLSLSPSPLLMNNNKVFCEDNNKKPPSQRTTAAAIQRKQTALQRAVDEVGPQQQRQLSFRRGKQQRRFNTKDELNKLRKHEKEIMLRWERDEDGWRDLPARAWPAYQPNEEQLKDIRAEMVQYSCDELLLTNDNSSNNFSSYLGRFRTTSEEKIKNKNLLDKCTELRFQSATALVFYNLNPQAGLNIYLELAESFGHVDSMVAAGIILVEGLGGLDIDEKRGMEWLERAALKHESAQGLYELGTIYYTGIDDVVEEDTTKAFQLFKKAAEKDHTAAMFMMADSLVEGEGTEVNVAAAVSLYYRAAERGHRYSRQAIRELLAKQEYKDK